MSDTLGAIFLIAIFAVATAIIGSGLLSQTAVIEVPATDLSLSIEDGVSLKLYNDGGDTIRRAGNIIYVDGSDRTADFETETGDPWTELEAGNYIKLELTEEESPESVLVVNELSSGGTQLIAALGDKIISPGATETPATTGTETPTPGSPPDADFSGSPTSGTRPLSVTFTDLSTENPTSWSWTFGDGNSSTTQNPVHTYVSAGTYTVSLTATNAYGPDTETKTNYITVNEQPPVANFSGSPTSGIRPITVTFTDLSTNSPSSWAWTFGDGNSSAAQNPIHTYVTAGTYTVSLNATNSGGSDTETKTGYITVNEQPPVADFTADVTSGLRPLTITFTDLSTNSPTSWAWTFGDGNSSTTQNPIHTYVTAGTYTVSLNATNSGGSDTETKTGYITVTEPTPHDIILNSARPGSSFRDGGYLEFRNTASNSNIYIDGTRYRPARNDIVRLTINSDTGGSIYGSGGRITTFSYSDVTLSFNGVTQATGAVTSIYIAGSTDYSSTLIFDVPAVDPPVWTQFRVDGSNLIYGSDGRAFVFSEIVPDNSRRLQLTSGGSYFRFRSVYSTTPPL